MSDTRPRDTEALPAHVAANREAWDRYADEYATKARRQWAETEISWGLWSIPESELRLLPEDVAGLDVIELGCGTAYVSSWLARRGARVTGIDNSPKQLATARALQRETGLEFPLILGNAETVPLPDASFDLAISEYGACLWADPYAWVPEAARLLRPGGRLAFLTNGLILTLCAEEYEANEPAKNQLRRPLFGLHRLEWPDDTSVEFQLPHGRWIDLLRANGFEIERLAEIQAPADAVDHPSYSYVTAEWARRWPSEDAWIARLAKPHA